MSIYLIVLPLPLPRLLFRPTRRAVPVLKPLFNLVQALQAIWSQTAIHPVHPTMLKAVLQVVVQLEEGVGVVEAVEDQEAVEVELLVLEVRTGKHEILCTRT